MAHIHDLIDFVSNAFIVFENKVLLIHHKELNTWLPIGGHIELNEDPVQALYREIKEECGLEVEIISKTPNYTISDAKLLPVPNFLDIHQVNKKHHHIAFNYFAKAKNKNVVLNTDEHFEIKWFSKEDLEKTALRENVRFIATEALKSTK